MGYINRGNVADGWGRWFGLARREKGGGDSFGSPSAECTSKYCTTVYLSERVLSRRSMDTEVLWCATVRLVYHGDFCCNLHTTVSTWILLFLPGYFFSTWLLLFLPGTAIFTWVLLILTGYHCFYMDTTVSTWILLFPPRYYCF
jgi:hypothetical protein